MDSRWTGSRGDEVKQPIEQKKGTVKVPAVLGLGIEVDREVLKRAAPQSPRASLVPLDGRLLLHRLPPAFFEVSAPVDDHHVALQARLMRRAAELVAPCAEVTGIVPAPPQTVPEQPGKIVTHGHPPNQSPRTIRRRYQGLCGETHTASFLLHFALIAANAALDKDAQCCGVCRPTLAERGSVYDRSCRKFDREEMQALLASFDDRKGQKG
jgi:hypothetical protein